MKKKYSEDDLIRKPWVRQIILGLGIIFIIIGTRGWDFNRSWESIIVIFAGVFLLFSLQGGYENLLEENQNEKNNGK